MNRGTTPTITIETDTDLREAQYVVVTIEDFAKNEISVDSKSGNLTMTASLVMAKLTQAQTLQLTKGRASIQIRALDVSGNAIASNIMSTQINDVLKDGEIP